MINMIQITLRTRVQEKLLLFVVLVQYTVPVRLSGPMANCVRNKLMPLPRK